MTNISSNNIIVLSQKYKKIGYKKIRKVDNNGKKKIITVCGSLNFKEEIMREAIRLELEDNIVLTPLFPLKEEDMPTKEEGNLLGNMHKEKIKIPDGIFVINVGSYIGESTKSEIALAERLHKEVKYLEEI